MLNEIPEGSSSVDLQQALLPSNHFNDICQLIKDKIDEEDLEAIKNLINELKALDLDEFPIHLREIIREELKSFQDDYIRIISMIAFILTLTLFFLLIIYAHQIILFPLILVSITVLAFFVFQLAGLCVSLTTFKYLKLDEKIKIDICFQKTDLLNYAASQGNFKAFNLLESKTSSMSMEKERKLLKAAVQGRNLSIMKATYRRLRTCGLFRVNRNVFHDRDEHGISIVDYARESSSLEVQRLIASWS